jgi:murein L,D-transpeptidase YafK
MMHLTVYNFRRTLPAGFLALLMMGGWMLTSPALAKNRTAQSGQQALAKPDPEVLLLEVYKDLAANHLRDAQAKADALVLAYPTFRLGQLIRGDLLLMHTRPVRTFGAVENAPADKLKNLREEAMVRLKSLRERPDPNMVPRALMQLRDDQKHALIVDAKKSRMYVYENRDGQPRLITDYYISQGKLGVNKIKEGDQKTPLGVYYITQRVPGAKLPDFYGAGALPINYPNEWDKVNGRSGSGIWLHGTPSDSYSRPPLSSDGCVVLTNPDLHKLYASVEINKTPVIITENVEFVSKEQWDTDRSNAYKLLDKWRRDVESRDANRLMSNYSSQFKSDHGENFPAWFTKHHQLLIDVKSVSIKLKDVTLFRYPGNKEMIVGTFTQDSYLGKGHNSVRKRQYWAKDGSQWKIISEATL